MGLTKGIIVKKISNAIYIVEDIFDNRSINMSVPGKARMDYTAKTGIGETVYLQVFPYDKNRGKFYSDIQVAKYFSEEKYELDNRELKN